MYGGQYGWEKGNGGRRLVVGWRWLVGGGWLEVKVEDGEYKKNRKRKQKRTRQQRKERSKIIITIKEQQKGE